MEERSEKCMRRENEHEKKQNGYYEQDMWIRLHDCQKTQRYRTV